MIRFSPPWVLMKYGKLHRIHFLTIQSYNALIFGFQEQGFSISCKILRCSKQQYDIQCIILTVYDSQSHTFRSNSIVNENWNKFSSNTSLDSVPCYNLYWVLTRGVLWKENNTTRHDMTWQSENRHVIPKITEHCKATKDTPKYIEQVEDMTQVRQNNTNGDSKTITPSSNVLRPFDNKLELKRLRVWLRLSLFDYSFQTDDDKSVKVLENQNAKDAHKPSIVLKQWPLHRRDPKLLSKKSREENSGRRILSM